MININFMKPFYTKVSGDKLRIVFAYQYFSIEKDDEVYHFVPIEGKEIIVNLKDSQVQNLSEIFVFQRGNRFIRLPLYQLLLVSNASDFLSPIIEINSESYKKSNKANDDDALDDDIKELLLHLEKMNYARAIDIALENNDEKAFNKLVSELNEMSKIS